MAIVKPRFFNQISVTEKDDIKILKKSSNDKKLLDEIAWYKKVPDKAKKYVPNIYASGTEDSTNWVEMEFINSKTVHELYIKKEMTVQEYKAFYANITKVLEELQSNCSKTKKNKNTFFNDRYQMYVSKTLERLSTLAQEQIFFPFFTNDITINKKSYPNLLTILSLVLKKVKKLLLTDDTFTFIHGDLHFSNIMYNPTSQEIKIFDPRGKFGSNQELGDSIYEWAKLTHSVHGKYDLITESLFDLKIKDTTIDYKFIEDSAYTDKVYKTFLQFVPKEKKKQVLLCECLLFFSMIPLHSDNYEWQIMMLCRTIELFYEIK